METCVNETQYPKNNIIDELLWQLREVLHLFSEKVIYGCNHALIALTCFSCSKNNVFDELLRQLHLREV